MTLKHNTFHTQSGPNTGRRANIYTDGGAWAATLLRWPDDTYRVVFPNGYSGGHRAENLDAALALLESQGVTL